MLHFFSFLAFHISQIQVSHFIAFIQGLERKLQIQQFLQMTYHSTGVDSVRSCRYNIDVTITGADEKGE